MIFFISELKCDPNISGKNKHTPLHVAVSKGHLNIIKYLIEEQNCNPLCLDTNGYTLLHEASSRGHLDVVKYLILERHCDPNIRSGRYQSSPIHLVSVSGHLDLVRFFIADLNCDPYTSDLLGRTALHIALYKGHFHIVKYLIEKCNFNPSSLFQDRKSLQVLASRSDTRRYLMNAFMVKAFVSALPFYFR